MRQIKKLWVCWLRATVEILMVSLVLCIVTVIALPDPTCYLWVAVLPLFSLLGVSVHPLLKKVPILDVLFDILLSGVLSYGLDFLLQAGVESIVCMGLLGAVLAIRSRSIVAKGWTVASSEYLYTVFMIIDLVFALLAGVIPILEPFRPVSSALGPVIVLAGLLSMNDLNVESLMQDQDERHTGHKVVSKDMKRQNRKVLLIFYGIVLALSLLKGVMSGLKWLAEKLFWLLQRLLDWLNGGDSGSSESTGGDGMAGLPAAEERIRSPFWERFEEIFTHVIAYAAVAAFTIFLCFMLYKGIRKLIAWLKTIKFNGDAEDSSVEEYTDTRERLFELKDLPSHYQKQAKDWLAERLKREPDWKSLKTVEERVRTLYRRAVYKAQNGGYHYSNTRTADQTLRQAKAYLKTDQNDLNHLGEYYDQVRYGNREPDAAAVESMNRKI